MQFRIAHALAAAGALVALVAACEAPTAPAAGMRPPTARHATATGPVEMAVLQRTGPLSAPVTVSASIGALGGRIAIPEAGFSIRIPRGALPAGAPVTISVTALAGSDVAYSFAPEGLVFAADPVISQDLVNTAAFGHPEARNSLQGAWYEEGGLENGVARVGEMRPTRTDVHGWKSRWTIHHFSGYLLTTTSKTGGYIGSSGRQ
jgi:hypothetical protein